MVITVFFSFRVQRYYFFLTFATFSLHFLKKNEGPLKIVPQNNPYTCVLEADSTRWANVRASTTLCANVWINRIDFTF